MNKLTEVAITAEEFRNDARMKRRQAEVLNERAAYLDHCAERLERAIETDAKRAATPAAPLPDKEAP